MTIKVICVGKIKEQYLKDGLDEYRKRIKPFCDLKIIEIKEVNTDDFDKNIHQESQAILNAINDDDFIYLLSLRGQNIDSVTLANKIKEHCIYSSRPLVFVIGGSNGVCELLEKRSDIMISFGKITYPHQLIRLVLFEQIYRLMMINHNQKYHK